MRGADGAWAGEALGGVGWAITLQEQAAGDGGNSELWNTFSQMMVDLEKEARINRTPWMVDPRNPPEHVADELRRRRLAPGSAEAVLWVE